LKPDFAVAYNNLGKTLNDQGKLDEAVVTYSQALSSNPNYAEAHYNLGNALTDQGKLIEAILSYRKALTLKPDFVDAHINLGNALKAQGKLDEAAASYRRVLSLKPDDAVALNNLGSILNDQGKLDEAAANYRRALNLKPDFAEAHNNFGRTLNDQGKLDEAILCYRRALTLKPDYAVAYYNLGNVLRVLGKLAEAVSSYRQALTLKPDFIDAHLNLGNAFMDQGKLDKAVSSYRQALTLKPDYADAQSNLFFCLNYQSNITQEEIYNESLQWGDRLLESIQATDRKYANSLRTDRRLRIGYVSPDFTLHSVAFFIEPVIRAHNREMVEIFCYSNVKKPDKVTLRLQAEADHWFSILGMDHEAVADRIKKDRIDVLVDLAGHTRDNSLPVFARKPAPVQMTWLGYPNTTGLTTMDYRLTDAVADPAREADRLHSEKLIRLEHGFLCYHPAESVPEVDSLPCLEHDYITFGSFNNLAKATPEVIRIWAKILHAVPDAHLLLKAKQLTDVQTRTRFQEMFAREGITQERLEMHNWLLGQADHLELYNRVDIGLDPFPYNGTTTTCEALWMGVPVVTMIGDRHASRVGASILHRAGLEEMVASSVKDYIQLAQSLALDRKRLQELRSSLRARIQNSELIDSGLFTYHLEEVYHQMWRKYCGSMLPSQK
jgi:predicted O-linked N-acetylglucosamine transferase (SPINDLY family)